jgi:hypothetical protein
VLVAETASPAASCSPSAQRPFGRGPRSVGHSGAGGALAFADPDAGLGFGDVTSLPIAAGMGGDPRWRPLIDAVHASLG